MCNIILAGIPGPARGIKLLTHISLFSGIGCESIAAEWAGFKTILHCEIDKDCQKVLKKHWPDVPIIGDIKVLEALCEEFVHIVGNERFLRVTQDVNLAIQNIPKNGDKNTKSNVVPMIENITVAESKRLSTITADGVRVVGNLKLSSFVWIIKTIMEMRNGSDTILHQSGKSLSKEDYPMIYKSSAITATTQKRCMEYAHIKTNDLILTLGVPCQPASIAGKRRGAKDDRWLWETAINIHKYFQPTWAVFENPTGISSLGEFGSFVQMGDKALESIPDNEATELLNILDDIEKEGYEVQPVSIPACGVGAPHKRQRIFIIAHSLSTGTRGFSRKIGDKGWESGDNREEGIRQENRQIGSSRIDSASWDDVCHTRSGGLPGESWRGSGAKSLDGYLGNESGLNPNTDSGRCQQCYHGQWSLSEPNEGSTQSDTDSEKQGLERTKSEGNCCSGRLSTELGIYPGWSENWIEVAQRLCSKTQPGVRSLDARTTTGLLGLSRVSKLKMLGNCNPPQQYYPIYKAIYDIESNQQK